MPYCENCGNKLNSEDKFCANCGTLIAQYEGRDCDSNNQLPNNSITYKPNLQSSPNDASFDSKNSPYSEANQTQFTPAPQNKQNNKNTKTITLVIICILFLFIIFVIIGVVSCSGSNSNSNTVTYSSSSVSYTTAQANKINDIVEESDNDTGARTIFDFDSFWDKYYENETAYFSTAANYTSSTAEVLKSNFDFISDISNYEITNGNQANSNKSVKIITPTMDWILHESSTTFGTEKANEKIINIQTLVSDTISQVHCAICISVMCEVSVIDASHLLDEALNKVAENSKSLPVFNNIAFMFSTTGTNNDNLTLTLYAVSDKGIDKFAQTRNIVNLSLDSSSNSSQINSASSETSVETATEIETTPYDIDWDEYSSEERKIKTLKNDSFIYDVYPELVSITGYLGNNTVIEIPSHLENLPVTVIDSISGTIEGSPVNYDFVHYKVKNVIIPETVIRIDRYAFGFCEGLEKIEIPDNVYSLGEEAFSHCTNLKSVKLSNNIRSLLRSTFATCQSLKSVIMPENLEFIGDNCFDICELTSIYIPASVKEIHKDSISTLALMNITDIYYGGTKEQANNIEIAPDNEYSFENCFGDATIHYNSQQ